MSSQDGIGRNWDAAYDEGDHGMIDILHGQAKRDGSVDYDFLDALEASQSSQPSSEMQIPSSQPFSFEGFDLSQPQIPTLLSGDPHSRQPSIDTSLALDPSTFQQHISPHELNMITDPISPNNPYPTPLSSSTGNGYKDDFDFDFGGPSGSNNHRRSTSAASHHTGNTSYGSTSGSSEYDCSATDVSEGEDAEMGSAEQNDVLQELNLGKLGLRSLKEQKTWTQQDQDATAGSEGKGGGVGPMRRKNGTEGKGDNDKLEHRRSINRKSAQKHRARRKTELDELNSQVAERDARIKQLESDLAVERAKNEQMREIYEGRSSHGSRRSSRGAEVSDAGDVSSSSVGPGVGEGKGAIGRRLRASKRGEAGR